MLDSIIRREIDIERWKDSPELVNKVLVHLNNLHRDALQKVLLYESQIRDAGGEPNVKVTVVWPKPPPEPEPPEEPEP